MVNAFVQVYVPESKQWRRGGRHSFGLLFSVKRTLSFSQDFEYMVEPDHRKWWRGCWVVKEDMCGHSLYFVLNHRARLNGCVDRLTDSTKHGKLYLPPTPAEIKKPTTAHYFITLSILNPSTRCTQSKKETEQTLTRYFQSLPANKNNLFLQDSPQPFFTAFPSWNSCT